MRVLPAARRGPLCGRRLSPVLCQAPASPSRRESSAWGRARLRTWHCTDAVTSGRAIAFTRQTSGRWWVRARSASRYRLAPASSRDYVWSPSAIAAGKGRSRAKRSSARDALGRKPRRARLTTDRGCIVDCSVGVLRVAQSWDRSAAETLVVRHRHRTVPGYYPASGNASRGWRVIVSPTRCVSDLPSPREHLTTSRGKLTSGKSASTVPARWRSMSSGAWSRRVCARLAGRSATCSHHGNTRGGPRQRRGPPCEREPRARCLRRGSIASGNRVCSRIRREECGSEAQKGARGSGR